MRRSSLAPWLALFLLAGAATAWAAAQPAARRNETAAALPFAVPGAPRPPAFGRVASRPRTAPQTLRDVLALPPTDSLDGPLRRFEIEHGRTMEGADAGFALGQFHYARGEYRQAGDAFARAAARYPPDRKTEARYWQGLSALGEGDAVRARAILEDLGRVDSPRRAAARYALAESWVRAGKPAQAVTELEGLLADRPEDMETPALERVAELSARLGDAAEAERATRELARLNPEAAEPVRRPPPAPAPAVASPSARGESGRIAVQIGAFSDVARAAALGESAREQGFPRTQVLTQGRGAATLHLVRIGVFPNETAARAAGERASRELGVAYRLIRNP